MPTNNINIYSVAPSHHTNIRSASNSSSGTANSADSSMDFSSASTDYSSMMQIPSPSAQRRWSTSSSSTSTPYNNKTNYSQYQFMPPLPKVPMPSGEREFSFTLDNSNRAEAALFDPMQASSVFEEYDVFAMRKMTASSFMNELPVIFNNDDGDSSRYLEQAEE